MDTQRLHESSVPESRPLPYCLCDSSAAASCWMHAASEYQNTVTPLAAAPFPQSALYRFHPDTCTESESSESPRSHAAPSTNPAMHVCHTNPHRTLLYPVQSQPAPLHRAAPALWLPSPAVRLERKHYPLESRVSHNRYSDCCSPRRFSNKPSTACWTPCVRIYHS